MSGWFPAPASRISAIKSRASTRMPDKIAALQNGKIPIYEPGLNQLVSSNAAAGRLDFSLDLKDAVAQADAVFIAVGTPSRRGDGHADLSYVHAAAREIAENLQGLHRRHNQIDRAGRNR